MISNLLHRCLIGNLKLLEGKYKITYFRALSVINLLDVCLIRKVNL